MKKLIFLAATLLAATLSNPALANGDGTGIVGSPHDFTDGISSQTTPDESWNGRNEICRVCHVPHDHNRASQYYLNGLLWNHEVSSASYTMYDQAWSSSMDNAQSAQPDGVAKLCLGCHDGTVAIDTFDKYTAGTVNISDFAGGGFQVGSFTDGANLDLRGTHPLSVTYDETVDTGLNAKTDPMGTSGTIADVLDDGKVQCSSCHDVHDQESVANTHLLRVAQKDMGGGEQASGLCLACHNK